MTPLFIYQNKILGRASFNLTVTSVVTSLTDIRNPLEWNTRLGWAQISTVQPQSAVEFGYIKRKFHIRKIAQNVGSHTTQYLTHFQTWSKYSSPDPGLFLESFGRVIIAGLFPHRRNLSWINSATRILQYHCHTDATRITVTMMMVILLMRLLHKYGMEGYKKMWKEMNINGEWNTTY